MRRLFPPLLTVSPIRCKRRLSANLPRKEGISYYVKDLVGWVAFAIFFSVWIFYATKQSKMVFLEGFFLTFGAVEQVPSDPWHFPITIETEVLALYLILLLFIVSGFIHLKSFSKELTHATSFERTCFFFLFLFLIIQFPFSVAYCDIGAGSPAIYFNSADPEIPPETGMPQGAPGHEIRHPIPIPPDIPRLDQPLRTDPERFIELQQRLQIYFLGHHRITDLAGFAGRLERAVPIERHIEAALVFDGYAPDRIRFRINEIRGILFTHPTRMLLLSEQTLDRYLMEIRTNGTRQSAPYMRVVRAIRNHLLLL
ncbi:hypothetical protein MRB53_036370 [Persea americana]|nr:hypothetical protein MRB53_036370 [Persea americana]